MEKLDKSAIKLLDRLYKDLYLNEEVLHHSTGNQYDKFNNIKQYLDKLEKIHTRVLDTGRHIELLKKLYYDKYVIKRENIPESYFKHQQEIALERGFGHVEITAYQRKEIEDEIINNQKKRLDIWLEYFLCEDSKLYPFWAKYWAFQGMLKLGDYDKEKEKYSRRSKDTVAPFADLNREALAMSIDLVIKSINKEEIDDKKLDELVKTGSFQKIYSYIITKLLKDNKNITKRNEGKWVKYAKGSDHMPLVNSLQGYNTGWCTAGESTAKSQLSVGDFYVYYTLDENGEYKVPRVAIRMENERIGEIRGIANDQNLEAEMESVVEEKIKDFPDKELYYKKLRDMKRLTTIYKKHKNCEELTIEELRFLYEIDEKIVGFGYDQDPRIEEIISQRNSKKKDLSYLLNCASHQIALHKNELSRNTIYFDSDLNFDSDLDLFNIFGSSQGLNLPQIIKGDLNLSRLTSAEGLVLPQIISGDLNLSGLSSAKGLILPESIGGELNLSGLTSARGLVLPQNMDYSLNLCRISSAKDLVLPQTIEGDLNLCYLPYADGLVLPQSIKGDLNLNGLFSAQGVTFPKSIGGDLALGRLSSAKGLKLPEIIGGTLYLYNLTSAKGLKLPKSIGGDLNLSGLYNARGLVLPETIGGELNLIGLTSVKNLVLPKSVVGNLNLSRLTSAEGLVLPETVGYDLHLFRLTNPEKLIIPDQLTYNIILSEFDITPENVNNYRKKCELYNIKNLLKIFKSKTDSNGISHKSK